MNSFYNLKMSLLIGNICFAWTGDYEALKTFVASDLKLNGNWEQPGGDKKVFYFNNNSIAWRRNKGLLQVEGDEVGNVIQILCEKILSVHSNSNKPTESDASCQTITNTILQPSYESTDIESEIEGLKISQAVDREIILSLSDSVTKIAEFIKHFQDENRPNSKAKITPSSQKKLSSGNNTIVKNQTTDSNINILHDYPAPSDAISTLDESVTIAHEQLTSSDSNTDIRTETVSTTPYIRVLNTDAKSSKDSATNTLSNKTTPRSQKKLSSGNNTTVKNQTTVSNLNILHDCPAPTEAINILDESVGIVQDQSTPPNSNIAMRNKTDISTSRIRVVNTNHKPCKDSATNTLPDSTPHNILKQSTPKHLVPCPFLQRRGFCLKGSSCDFSHTKLRPSNVTQRPLPNPMGQFHPPYPPQSNFYYPPFPVDPRYLPPYRLPAHHPLDRSHLFPLPLMSIPTGYPLE